MKACAPSLPTKKFDIVPAQGNGHLEFMAAARLITFQLFCSAADITFQIMWIDEVNLDNFDDMQQDELETMLVMALLYRAVSWLYEVITRRGWSRLVFQALTLIILCAVVFPLVQRRNTWQSVVWT